MSNFENRRFVSTRWQTWVGWASALILGACTNSASPASQDVVAETDDTGATVRVSRPDSPGNDLPEETTPRATEDILAGCTHIRFCNAPGAAEVVCDTNDNPSCTPAQRRAECLSDANSVCGNWTTIEFDPPIP